MAGPAAAVRESIVMRAVIVLLALLAGSLGIARDVVAPLATLPMVATLQVGPTCPKCKKPIEPQWKFCQKCGGKLTPKPYTPKVGSAERQAILDAVRTPVVKALGGKKVVFVPSQFRVFEGWAFVFAEPREADGKPLKVTGTRFEEQAVSGAWDANVSALLRKIDGKWKVLELVIGATDVPWVEWPERHRAPKGIFPPMGA